MGKRVAHLNAHINVAAPGGLSAKAALAARRVMYRRFLELCRVGPTDELLDVGVTSDRSFENSNYLEAWYPHREKVIAAGIDDAAFLEDEFPGIRFVRADGRALPFADATFDVVHSSAVIEHVGTRADQAQLLRELARVARRHVFLTTPNRWYPVEFHTLVPLLHWLPQGWFFSALRRLGRAEFADVSVLNLLTPRALRSLASQLPEWEAQIHFNWFLGIPSNLLLVLERRRTRT